jgi:hypothetical protein
MSNTATMAPSAKRRQIAAPMPPAPPVTMVTFPLMPRMLLSF